MDWNRVEGNWKQMKGKVKEKWGNLTDDDLTAVNGKRDQLEGKIQERYGLAKDQVRRMSTTGTIRRIGSTSCPHAKLPPQSIAGVLLVCRALIDNLEVEVLYPQKLPPQLIRCLV